MSDRERLLAELEARRQAAPAEQKLEILAADLSLAVEDTSYNPYDNPGHAKPLRLDGVMNARRAAVKRRKRR